MFVNTKYTRRNETRIKWLSILMKLVNRPVFKFGGGGGCGSSDFIYSEIGVYDDPIDEEKKKERKTFLFFIFSQLRVFDFEF